MQISDQANFGMRASSLIGNPSELRLDQTVTVNVKQQLSSNQAVVEIQGKEYTATFADGVPKSQNVNVQIMGRKGEELQVRKAPVNQIQAQANGGTGAHQAAADQILKDAGIKATPELKQAVSVLLQQKVPLDKTALQAIDKVIQKGEGTQTQKIDTLSLMGQRKIAITVKSYQSVYRTIHGPSLDDVIRRLSQEAPQLFSKVSSISMGSNSSGTAGNRLVRQLDTLRKAIDSGQPINSDKLQKLLQQIKQNPEIRQLSSDQLKEATSTMNKAAGLLAGGGANQPASTDSAGNSIAQLIRQIRSDGKISRSQLNNLQEMINQLIKNQKLSPTLEQDVQQVSGRLLKDIRMSVSYEAVGRKTDANVMLKNSLDSLIKLFKIPAVEEYGNSEATQQLANSEGSGYLQPVGKTFQMLGQLAGMAVQEAQRSLADTQSMGSTSVSAEESSRPLPLIVKDLTATVRSAAISESLPKENMRHIEKKLQQVESLIKDMPSSDYNAKTHETVKEIETNILNGMKDIEQLLTQTGDRFMALTSVQAASFERITTYIPDHLQQVGEEFKQVKTEITSNVTRMAQFLDQKVPQAPSYIQRIIEPTIEMVDRLVNKGEFALFADMEFEHNVLNISGELQKVKGLLANGKREEALQSFQSIKSDLDKLNWQPSYTKVERFFSKATNGQELQSPFQTYGQQWKDESLTGRGVQEWLKGMGLNHEKDAMDWLMRKGNEDSKLPNGTLPYNSSNPGGQEDRPPHNFKSMMLESMNSPVSPHAKEVMEQALSNITGMQLLSKQDPQSPTQALYAQIPIPWQEGEKTVNVQVQARTQGQSMDWQNCNLFFFLDTPNGETGIGITVADRGMSIRIQNDRQDIEQAYEPFIPQLKKELQGIGYHVNGVTFGAQPENEKKEIQTPTIDTEKARAQAKKYSKQEGVDFSV